MYSLPKTKIAKLPLQSQSHFVRLENTHHRGKYHWMNDLLFNWFGFDQMSRTVVHSTLANQLNPNKINRRSAKQWYFPLSKHSLVRAIRRVMCPDKRSIKFWISIEFVSSITWFVWKRTKTDEKIPNIYSIYFCKFLK